MSNPIIPIDRYEAKESGRAIQEAQNTVMSAGTKATIALIRELLKSLKLPQKSAYVQISINDSVAYRATIRPQDEAQLREMSSSLSEEQLRYLKEVMKLPESEQPAASSIPLDKDVTVEVNGKEVLRLKNGVVERNLLVPAPKKAQEPVSQTAEVSSAQGSEVEPKPAQVAQVEVVEEGVRMPEGTGVSLSGEQRQGLQRLGVNPERLENAIGQQAQGNVPIIVVLNREVEGNAKKSPLKNNLKSNLLGFQKAVQDFSKKVSSFLGSLRDKLLPKTNRDIKRDLQNLAVIDLASKLLDRFGGQTDTGKQVFEGNSFRLERQGKDLSVIAKDGRGNILSLKDGELTGSLTQKDVEKFQAVERQLNQGKSRRSQAEIG
ncbi:MAG: hypothetical protein ACK52I_35810 [Pseudomonadota bacterium]|jgi:hypothetical protein